MGYVYLLIAIVSEVIATSALAASNGLTRAVPVAILVVGYAIAFACLALAVRAIPVGVAYAIWSGLGIVLIAAIAWIWLGQKLDLPALVGLALIIAGVVIIQLFSRATRL
jgi:small multidrug resistance pump